MTITLPGTTATLRRVLPILFALGTAGVSTAQTPTPAPAADTSASDGAAASTVEAGIGDVSKGSYKAGEYNGLQNAGALFVGNFDVRDRGDYADSARRW